MSIEDQLKKLHPNVVWEVVEGPRFPIMGTPMHDGVMLYVPADNVPMRARALLHTIELHRKFNQL